MRRFTTLAAVAALFAVAAPASAHHSGAMFDRDKQVTLVGTVKDFQWTNPHSSFAVEVMRPDGTGQVWGVEMNSPQNLIREGWTRTTLKPGDKVTALINPLRDGKPGGVYVGVGLPDGRWLGGKGN